MMQVVQTPIAISASKQRFEMPDKACCYKLTSVFRVTLSKNEPCSSNQFMSSFTLILLKRRACAHQKRLRDLGAPEPAQLGSSHGTGAGPGQGPV